jgi:hypothetical protein
MPSITNNTMAVCQAGATPYSEDLVVGTAGGAVAELMMKSLAYSWTLR